MGNRVSPRFSMNGGTSALLSLVSTSPFSGEGNTSDTAVNAKITQNDPYKTDFFPIPIIPDVVVQTVNACTYKQ